MINDVEQVLAAYETWLLQQPLAKNTHHAYRFHVRQYMEYLTSRPTAEDDPLHQSCARGAAVCDYKHYLKTHRKAQPTTINLSLAAIDHLYLFLGLDRGKVQREDLPERSPRTLSSEEQKVLLRVVESSASFRDRALAFLLYSSGLRLGECAALNVDDIVHAGTEALVVVRSGTGEIKREVRLNAQGCQALEQWLQERSRRFPSLTDPALFLNSKGQRLSTRSIDQTLRAFGHEAHLDLSASILRHTYLSNLVRDGLDLTQVAQLAGYTRLETTRKYSLPVVEDRTSVGEEIREDSSRSQRANRRTGDPDRLRHPTSQRGDEVSREDTGAPISQSCEQSNGKQTQGSQAPLVLLRTKLTLPPLPPHWVPRPRLTQLLQCYASRLLTVVYAPAGFGKTTLLGEWAVSSQWPVAWVSLSREENDPLRFLAYSIQALQEQFPQIGTRILSRHLWQQSFVADILAEWINELISLPQDVTILLDHYQVITNSTVHELVQLLIEHLPPCVHLMIASRNELPFSLARLYAHGQAAELGTRELRFTPQETRAFLSLAMPSTPSPEELSMLEQRSEGWIVALQLAVLALQRGDDPTHRFASPSAGNRYLQSYLLEEVLEQQPSSLQTFLLQTSLLTCFTDSLCRAVTGKADTQVLLEKLKKANLFLFPLEEQEGWYRYHPLFAEALRSKLQSLYPELVPQLYARASRWFEEQGSTEEAITYALAAQDCRRAAALIEQIAPSLLSSGGIPILQGWLASLPTPILRTSPRLCITAAWLQHLTTQSEEFISWLDVAEEVLQAREEHLSLEDATALRGEIVALRAIQMNSNNEFALTIAACNKVLLDLPADNVYVRSFVLLCLGTAYLRGVNAATAAQLLSQAVSGIQEVGTLLLSYILEMQAEVHLTLGCPFQAMKVFQQILDMPDMRKGFLVGTAYCGLGELFWEWNDLETAKQYLLQAWEIGMQESNPNLILNTLFILAKVSQAQGLADEVNDWLQQTEVFIQKIGYFKLFEEVERCRIWFALEQGRLEDALQWVRQSSGREERKLRYEDEKILQIEILIAVGRASADMSYVQEALSLLESLRASAESIGRTRMLIEVLVLQALTLHLQGDVAGALCALERVVSLAEAGKYIRLFVERGEPMAKLLRQLREQHRTQKEGEQVSNPAYVRRLLAACAQPASHCWLVTPGEGQPLLDPLSWREREVLRLIAAGRKNEEIARELVVVLGTVKAHINSIYRKLDVNNRVQAIARARALQII